MCFCCCLLLAIASFFFYVSGLWGCVIYITNDNIFNVVLELFFVDLTSDETKIKPSAKELEVPEDHQVSEATKNPEPTYERAAPLAVKEDDGDIAGEMESEILMFVCNNVYMRVSLEHISTYRRQYKFELLVHWIWNIYNSWDAQRYNFWF